MKKENIIAMIDQQLQKFKSELVSKIDEFVSDSDAEMGIYMDVSEVSQLMNLSKKTIRKYAAAGKLPFSKDVSGRLRFKKEDIEKFIKNIQSNKYGIESC